MKLGRRLGLVLAAILAALVAVEVAFRVWVGPVSRVNYTPVPDGLVMESTIEGIPFMLKPGGSGTQRFETDPRGAFDPGATLTYQINEQGFRGPEATVDKPAGTFRIVALGDSFTFGEGVRVDESWPAQLEQAFAEARGDDRVEVLNLGVPGWHTGDEVSYFERRGLRFAPDVVVIGYFLNDAGGAVHSLFHRIDRQDDRRRRLPWWRRWSVAGDRLATRLDRADMVADQVASFRNAYKPTSRGWMGVQGALKRADELGRRNGFRLVLVIYPVLWHLSRDYPFQEIHDQLREFAEGEGIATLDLLPAFGGQDGPELWVHPNNQHPNALAHAIAAGALFDFLTREGIVSADG